MCLTDPYSLFHFSLQIIGYLGGGFKYVYFRPQNCRIVDMIQFDGCIFFQMGWKPTTNYCWWMKSCTTWDVQNLVNHGINYLSTGAGFLPSTVGYHSTFMKPCRWLPCVFVDRRGFCAKVKKLLVADLSKRFGNLKVRMMGANKNPKPLAGAAGEGFSKIWVVLGRFPVCEDFFLLYQVGRRIYQTQ